MSPDPLSEAAARRHELTRAKAVQALRELDRAGAPVTFARVAQEAGISRSWLYTQPWLRRSGVPGIIGSTGAVRSRAWICGFSSTAKTAAFARRR